MVASLHPQKSMLITSTSTATCFINVVFLIFMQNKNTNFNGNSLTIRASISYIDTCCVMPTGIWLTGWKTYKRNPTKDKCIFTIHSILHSVILISIRFTFHGLGMIIIPNTNNKLITLIIPILIKNILQTQ